MIERAKAFAKRHWPRLHLRTILLITLLFVAALPGFGAVFLRVYENTLVRQTEAELIAQGAALVAAAQANWPDSRPHAVHRLRPDDYRPEPPGIDLNDTPILPERPEPLRTATLGDPRALHAAQALEPILVETSRTTLASIQILDARGHILTGNLAGASYAHIPEVRSALKGQSTTVLRHNGTYSPRYALEWLSRAADIRIHHVRPIEIDGQVAGAILISRSPRALFRGIYQDLGKILIGIVSILVTLVLLSGLLSRGIARPIEELSAATRDLAMGGGHVPEPPPTAAIEIQALYRDFGIMAAAIERRSHYVRDFAHAVSHEFKTPLAAIRGAVEILEDHHSTMSDEERQRFLGNASADADRLAQLVTRLLELARADMAQPQPDVETRLAPVIHRVVDALRKPDLAINTDLAGNLPAVIAPAGTIEAVLSSLIENGGQAGAQQIWVSARADADHIILDVADDGPGIPSADQARVFEPFFTSRRSAGGTGLGLSITRALLEASHATIALLPSEKGACFRIWLRPSP